MTTTLPSAVVTMGRDGAYGHRDHRACTEALDAVRWGKPKELGGRHKGELTKREISQMIDSVYRYCGQKETVIFCDKIMKLGFHHAFGKA